MKELDLSIPKRLRIKLAHYPVINWSSIARNALIQRLRDIELMERLKSESELTEEEAIKLGRELKEKVAKIHLKKDTR